MINRFALAVLLMCFSSATRASASSVAADVYGHPQQLVTIGARRLNLYCVGEGSPTVLLDSGLGDTMLVWRSVQLQIADVTRVCSYDRAGYGFSDAMPGPSDAISIVEAIHNLITAAHIRAPIVYVGHSIAGIYGVLLEAKHPEDVAGEVLVDPSFANQMQLAFADQPKLFNKAISDAQKALRRMRSCLALAQKGDLVDPKTKTAQVCVQVDDVPDSSLHKVLVSLAENPKDIRTQISEFASFFPAPSGAESKDQQELGQWQTTDFGTKPMIVLTRTKGFSDPSMTSAQTAYVRGSWVSGHDRLAALSKRGKNILVPNTNHYIQLDQPAAVISAVRDVVTEVRGKK